MQENTHLISKQQHFVRILYTRKYTFELVLVSAEVTATFSPLLCNKFDCPLVNLNLTSWRVMKIFRKGVVMLFYMSLLGIVFMVI